MATNQEMLDRISQLSMAIQQKRMSQQTGQQQQQSYRPYARPPNVYRPTYPATYRPTYRPNLYRPPPNYSSYRPPATTTTYPARSTTATPQSQHRQLINQHNNTIVKSVDPTTGRQQVSVNGVEFIVKGKKLVRKDVLDKTPTSTAINAPKYLVRKIIKRPKGVKNSKNKVFIRGLEGYVRQGPKALVLKTSQPKKKRYCGFYTRYGKCPNADRCQFVHDPSHRAICPRFLQGKCQKQVCRLSHQPNEHIMPHCVHFQKGACKNDPCIYPHVRVNPQAPVCKAFAMEGYCPRGLQCEEKHIHVCPEFAETGKCSNANCRLPHVARKHGKGIIRLSSWVSPHYAHAQKQIKVEKDKAIVHGARSLRSSYPVEQQQQPEVSREKEEEEGFVRLFDDSEEDDGWSQYQRDDLDENQSHFLRFKEEEEEEDEDEEVVEEEEEEDKDDESDMEEVYEEMTDGEEERNGEENLQPV
ncbi:hypothetical protein BCV72DRAFT_64129 [Rhizopus microsporus var. microsporus]|uniref:C3H1-type domain-containing protein n=2 Tax=Rhizopus microsporus TaxID=58291 RepID=A0A2G4T1D3_RHIZD|nr:uncharacterized protein RHIMIDRAFT_249448 [Rhizopus microsporus ATCC 52813]ORE09400.1 hypothetical protein BCV72DRAFT_64129 [Rhizopus microsporus var. microsporus]PHZ14486.1 hypothetical protein RHIMIDRAFT_249448 [Rhizopus microsporus ATCC 52813]